MYFYAHGDPLRPSEISQLVGARRIMQKPALGEMCYVPQTEKLWTSNGTVEPSVYLAIHGSQKLEENVMASFAVSPQTFEPCSKLDDVAS